MSLVTAAQKMCATRKYIAAAKIFTVVSALLVVREYARAAQSDRRVRVDSQTDFVLNLLVLLRRPEPRARGARLVHEYLFASVVRCDEPESFRDVEPFHLPARARAHRARRRRVAPRARGAECASTSRANVSRRAAHVLCASISSRDAL